MDEDGKEICIGEFMDCDIYETYLPSQNFMSDITATLQLRSVSENVTIDDAIAINHEMQFLLRTIQTKLQYMLQKCRKKYVKNAEFLKNSMDGTNKQKRFKSYIYCGYPFFKNDCNEPAPLNKDYLHRRDVLKEFFPTDMMLKKSYQWTLRDKVNIIKGIKQQVNGYLIDENNRGALLGKRTRQLKERVLINNSKFSDFILVDLLKKAGRNFKINWFLISAESLGYRHSECSAEAMWQLYLRPELNRSEWSTTDSDILIEAARANNFSNWSAIASRIGNRSEYQCFVHYHTTILETLREKNIKWTKEDDELLLEAIEISRMGNVIRWNIVQQYFPHRNKKQLNTRYSYSLDPRITKGNFTKEEDCIILAAVEQYGANFSAMPIALFPGRTIVQIRNRYHNTIKFIKNHRKWSLEDDQKLLEWVEKYGTTSWGKLADEFGYRSRNSCRQRHATILKFMEKNPNASLNEIPRKYKQIKSDITRENWAEKIMNLKLENVASALSDKRPETKYISTLRCLEKKYYDFLKYGYDFEYNKEHIATYNPTSNLNFLISIFEVKLTKSALDKCKESVTKIELDILKRLVNYREYSLNVKEMPNKILLPPSWSTLLGFRSICIQCASKTDDTSHSAEKDTKKGVIAKALFKNRFHKIFYNTILLSRLNADIVSIPEQCLTNEQLQITNQILNKNGRTVTNENQESKIIPNNTTKTIKRTSLTKNNEMIEVQTKKRRK